MRCPRCGNPVSPSAAQCAHCGQPLRAAAPVAATIASATLATTAMQQAYERQRKRNLIVGAVTFGLALLALGFFGLRASGALEAKAVSPQDKLLAAKGTAPGDLLMQTAHSTPPVLHQNGQAPNEAAMPEDVYEWLKHLEKCEAMKVQIAGDETVEIEAMMPKMQALGAGMGLMDPYDQSGDDSQDKSPDQYTKGKILDLRPDWDKLITFFHSKPPPAECVPIANDFDQAINEIPGEMGDIGDILNTTMTDPSAALKKISKMKNGSYGDIDRYFLRCDQKVGAICDKYRVAKWFNIKGDVVVGGTLGQFGSGLPTGSLPGSGP